MCRSWVGALATATALGFLGLALGGEKDPPSAGAAAPDKAKRVVTDKPLRIKIDLPQAAQSEVKDALASSPPKAVKLSLGVAVPPVGKPGGARGLVVYVNLPSAASAADLSEDGDYWVGAVEFKRAEAANKPQGFNLDLSGPLATQGRKGGWDSSKPVTITLIGVPEDRAAGLAKDLSIPVQKLEVSASAAAEKK